MDGVGVFTIDAIKAKIQLGQHQLADPSGYLLKFVQAGVQMGAVFLSIELYSNIIRIRYTKPALRLGRELFLELLQKPYDSGRAAHWRTLATALNAAPSTEIAMVDRGRGEVTQVGSEIGLRRFDAKDNDQVIFHLKRAEKASSEIIEQERRAIATRGYLCPVPLYCQSKAVNSGVEAIPMYAEKLFPGSRVLAAEAHQHESERSGLGLPGVGRKAAIGWCDGVRRADNLPNWDIAVGLRTRPRDDSPWDLARTLVVFPVVPEGSSFLTIVQYGVVTETRRLDLGFPGAEAALCADGLPTDLEGKLRDTPEVQAELDCVVAQASRLAQHLRGELPNLADQRFSELGGTAWVGGVTGGLVGGGIGLFAGGFLGMVTGFTLGAFFGTAEGAGKIRLPSRKTNRAKLVNRQLQELRSKVWDRASEQSER